MTADDSHEGLHTRVGPSVLQGPSYLRPQLPARAIVRPAQTQLSTGAASRPFKGNI